MINDYAYINTRDIFESLYERQGGNLFYNRTLGGALTTDIENWHSAVNIPSEYKEFSMSIYNTKTDTEIARLSLFVNPSELVIGQQQPFGSVYTRRGWVNTAWGNDQSTISASGVSAGFYYYNLGRGGLTNAYRRQSPSFVNLMDIVGMYRNNGWYFLNGATNPDLFNTGGSRVINVMDSIKIDYDGTTYIGSFNTFSLNDVADSPYKMSYSFEFIVSSFGTDLQDVEGHLSQDDNYKDQEVHIALQGSDTEFQKVIGLDAVELNTYFVVNKTPDPILYTYTTEEDDSEVAYYKGWTLVKIPEGTFRVTRGWNCPEYHGGKCDYRTYTSKVYSATEGQVVKVKTGNSYGDSNYVLVLSNNGLFIRYYHMDPTTIRVSVNDYVKIGTVIGEHGTDGGKYPPHCDFLVKKVAQGNINFDAATKIDCSSVMQNMWNVLHARIGSDPELAKDFTNLVFKGLS